MTTVQEALLALTKPTTDAVKNTVSTLLIHVCQSATKSSSSSNNNQDAALNNNNNDDDAGVDVTIEATSVSQPLVVNLLSCKNPNLSNAIPAPPATVQRAHALVCVIDRVFSYKGSNVKSDMMMMMGQNNNNNALFEPHLVNAAWNVLKRELEIEMPTIVAAVVGSFPQKQAAAMLLIVKKWLNERFVTSEESREALQNAIKGNAPQKTINVDDNVDGDNNMSTIAKSDANNNNQNQNEDAAAGSAGSSSSLLTHQQQKIKLTSAEARKRIELIKHLCEGLENIPQGNSDALTLRNTLLEFGLDTAMKNGGTKRWGTYSIDSSTLTKKHSSSSSSLSNNNNSNIAIGGEIRALMAVLQGQQGLKLTTTDNNNDGQEGEDEAEMKVADDGENSSSIATTSSTSAAAQRLLNESCDAVDDVLMQLERKRQEALQQEQASKQQRQQQNEQQQQNLAPTATSIANKKHPFTLPVYSSLVLDRPVSTVFVAQNNTNSNKSLLSGFSGGGSSSNQSNSAQEHSLLTKMMSNDTSANNNNNNSRGPLPPPDAESPYFVPARLSENGKLAHRYWAPRSDQWATARNSVADLKWAVIEGINDNGETTLLADDQQQQDAAAGDTNVKRVLATSQQFFF